jgi:hypothetical protein
MEAQNLLNSEQKLVKQLKEELEAWQNSVFDSWEGKDYLEK